MSSLEPSRRTSTSTQESDLEQALIMGVPALQGDRQSVPSLIMTSRELTAEMRRRHNSEPGARDYRGRLHALGQEKPGFPPQCSPGSGFDRPDAAHQPHPVPAMPYGGAVQVRLGVEREPVYGALKPTTFVMNGSPAARASRISAA